MQKYLKWRAAAFDSADKFSLRPGFPRSCSEIKLLAKIRKLVYWRPIETFAWEDRTYFFAMKDLGNFPTTPDECVELPLQLKKLRAVYTRRNV